MARIRVLVVDDTVVIRKLVSDVLSEDPEIEVVGVAANGKIAVDKVRQVTPDLVTLDIEMPIMDGIEALSKIRETHPDLPVIMFSTLTERGAAMTLEALSRGATDYVTKPSQTGSLDESLQRVRRELLPKVRSLARRTRVTEPEGSPRRVRTAAPRPRTSRRGPVEVVVVGVSTGGPNALSQLIPGLEGALDVPLLIVQHMPPMFTRMLADRLDASSLLSIREGCDGAPVESGRAFIAPGGRHMEVQRSGADVRVVLSDGPEENSCRPSVDVLFRSVAQVYGSRALAVILTGMGQDGLRGCELVSEAGGIVVAQDEASSVVWGMPGAVVRAGLADDVVSLDQMAAYISRTLEAHARPRGARRTAAPA